MRVLLDTHILLWLAEDSPRLPADAQATIVSYGQPVFSVVTLWEVAIKTRLGRPDFDVDPRELRSALLYNGYEELIVTGEHAVAVFDLPIVHNDPFDRLLVAQARTTGILLLTADRKMADYGSPVRLI